MTVSEFEELRQKSQKEYEEYFDEHAWHTVEICSIKLLCIKLTNKKAGLRDKSIFTLNDGEEMKFLDDAERSRLRRQEHLWRRIKKLPVMNMASVEEYLEVLEEKVRLEEEIKEVENMITEKWDRSAQCSFCGKYRNQVRKAVRGPSGMFICDECARLCVEIINKENKSEAQFPREDI